MHDEDTTEQLSVLNKAIARSGIASRRQAVLLVQDGRIKVIISYSCASRTFLSLYPGPGRPARGVEQ
jgi:hypothetical protein